jgi:hypothetical protein
MADRLCKCGCGTEMPSTNKWEYYRGHKQKGSKGHPPPARRAPNLNL